MTADSQGLHKVANTSKADRRADIVFLHGLGGSSHQTWRHGKEARPGHFFWPDELGKQLTDCGIWSVGYPAGFTGLGKQGMIIEKRAGHVSDTLANGGLGDRPILFITHSMGGLIVKHLIVDSQVLSGEDRKRIVGWVRGIVFCGTPHRGSGFADAARVFGVLGGGSQAHVDEMRANAEKLDLLHDKFIEWHRQHPVPVESYAENQKLTLTRWLFFATDYGVVVPRASANPGIAGCGIHDSDDDHLTLVKPRDEQHNVYAGVLRFIQKALNYSRNEPGTEVGIPDLRRRLLAAKSERELQALLFEAQVLSPTAGSGILVQEVRRALEYERRPIALANSRDVPSDLSRILKYAPAELIGRESDLSVLSVGWEKVRRAESPRPHVLTFVALGGEGKTSLVAKWAAELAAQDWPGCDAAFAWSFYSQGTREQQAASSDLFLKEALTFFGDDADRAFAASPAGPFEKGQRLARIVGQRRSLLILDGLEPLQYAPTSPTPGQLKDQGIAALLKGLAATSHGLCLVTTRYSLPDLRAFWQTTAPEVKLLRLSRDAGVHLLQTLGVRGTAREFETLVEDVKGHALTLQILGGFLSRAFGGDIRQRDRVDLVKADAAVGTGQAFRALAAYERHLSEQFAKAVREDIQSKSPSVFLSHASEDKDSFARPLANELKKRGLDIWFDEFVLKLGDSIRGKIDQGLADCDFAVAVLSEHFFRKPWPQQEVSGLTAREVAEKRKIILPVWHGVNLERVTRYSPLLADRLAVPSTKGVEVVAEDILNAITPQFHPTTRVQRSAELMLLRLFGLFDGPVSLALLRVILEPPEIPDLTEGLVGASSVRINQLVSELEQCGLTTAVSSGHGDDLVADLHPIVREFFSIRLKEESLSAFQQAHGRLFEHLQKTVALRPSTAEELTPLYRAVVHGCLAGRHPEAKELYVDRILRGHGPDGNFSTKLGLIGANLGAVSCFFERPWSQPVRSLPEVDQSWLLNEAALLLRIFGRLSEAVEPMRAAIEFRRKRSDWNASAISYSNLSELELTLGEVAGAVGDAEQSVTYADRSGDAFQRQTERVILADALHHAGRRAEAETRFREAEQMQQKSQPDYPLLYSLRGFQYCDLLLAAHERAAWQISCSGGLRPPGERRSQTGATENENVAHRATLQTVSQRAAQTLKWAEQNRVDILSAALDHLTLGRAALYAAILENSDLRLLTSPDLSHIDAAVAGLRRAGQQIMLPHALLTRASLRYLTGACTGPESAQEDLDEAWEIAERGPMRLHMADIHLSRARLFGRPERPLTPSLSPSDGERVVADRERVSPIPYPWESPAADLAAAEKLIKGCGYHRRDEELADAKQSILS